MLDGKQGFLGKGQVRGQKILWKFWKILGISWRNKMRIRIYYTRNEGTVKNIAIEGSGEWNLLELNGREYGSVCEQIEFELTEENLEKYMDNPHEVDLEQIQIEEIENNIL